MIFVCVCQSWMYVSEKFAYFEKDEALHYLRSPDMTTSIFIYVRAANIWYWILVDFDG